MKKRGPLQIDSALFTPDLRTRLTANVGGFGGRTTKTFPVYQEQNGYVLIPRYTLGIPAFHKAEDAQWSAEDKYFPAFSTKLWPEQLKGAEEALKELKGNGGTFINAKPGSGKTVVALWLTSQLRPHKVLVLVDQDNLADQWTERIKQFMPKATVTYIMPLASQRALHTKHKQEFLLPGIQRHDLRGNFVICMAQTLVKHPKPITVGMLVVDEAHVFSAPTFSQAIFNLNYNWSLALSAETTRADGNEWIFQQMAGPTTIVLEGKRKPAAGMFYAVDTEFMKWGSPDLRELADYFRCVWCKWHRKMTCRYECRSCYTSKEVGTSDPFLLQNHPGCASTFKIDEFNDNAIERMLATDPVYNAWLIETIQTFLHSGRDIFVFARLREPLVNLMDSIQMIMGDICGLYLGGAVTEKERARNQIALAKRVTLTTFGKSGKGLDVQRKDGILFAGPVSKRRLNQAIGRIERDKAGKKNPISIHPIIPFVTHVARARGCKAWYKEHGYDFTIQDVLARKI